MSHELVSAREQFADAVGEERLNENLFQMVRNEIDRAKRKHGWVRTPAAGDLSDEACLVILVEEVGEVARAMTYDEGDPAALDAELVQVAAMALAWLNGRRVRRVRELRGQRIEITADGGVVRAMNGLGEPLPVYDKLKEDTGEFAAVNPDVCCPFHGPNTEC